MNLKELSQQLGLSQTTVSRALNGYPEVSERTRSRVVAAAKEFHYAPSSSAKGLATGRANAIGHVISNDDGHHMVNPIFGDFIAGAGEEYARQGHQMILSVLENACDEEKVYRQLKSRRAVDGVVIHSPRKGDPRIQLLTDIGLPFVVHGRVTDCPLPYAWLDVNNRSAFRRATNFLFDLGHRRIALLNGLEHMDFAQRRRRGFEEAMASHNVIPDPRHLHSSEMTEDYGYQVTRDMLDAPNPPTAIVTSSMITALGTRRAIEESGRVMGHDISVITHDDRLSYLRNGGDVPIFTATRSSVHDAGRQLAQMLLQMIAQTATTLPNKLLEAELTVGQSTGPVSPKKD